MRKSNWFLIIGLVLLASITFMSCDNAVAPPVIEPPEEVIFEWLDVVPDGFWNMSSLKEFEVIRSTSIPSAGQINQIYFVFRDDYVLELWFDTNDDKILSPLELQAETEWGYDNGDLWIEAYDNTFEVVSVDYNDWCVRLDLEKGVTYNFIQENVSDFDGYIEMCFTRGIPVYEDENHKIRTEFPFAFSDRNEEGFIYYLKSCGWFFKTYWLEEDDAYLDKADGFYFTWGDADIAIVTVDGHNQSFIYVDGIIYSLDENENEFVFEDSVVYDMTIVVDTLDNAIMTFIPRVPVDTIVVNVILDHLSLGGGVTIRIVNDVAGLVL